MEENKLSKRIPFSSVIAIVFSLIIFYWFVTGNMYSFYASAVFFFYSLTQMMWVSVIMLGVFQTLLLIPFRIIRLLDFKNIRDFQSETVTGGNSLEHETYLKQQFKKGSWTFTFYLLDFLVQVTSYMTIGRLFLTDFYTKSLKPDVLFSFVKYPDYPLLDRFFKIPYPNVTKTIDLGFETVLYVWLLIIIIELIVSIIKSTKRFRKKSTEELVVAKNEPSRSSGKYMLTYGVILMVVSYFLIRNFPIGWKIGIFSGDVARPNRTFNSVTAIATFLTLMWFGINDILRKSKIAKEVGLSSTTVETTQKKLFKDSFSRASLIGAGAFFITNQIPCAFELSVFTLEVISLFSPLTLDKWILRVAPKKAVLDEDKREREEHEVKRQFSDRIEE